MLATEELHVRLVFGETLDWLSQKLNEKLELVQHARKGLGHGSGTIGLNHCVTFTDAGLT